MKPKQFFMHLIFRNNRKKVRKKGSLLGRRFVIPRSGEKGVDTILYFPQKISAGPMAVVFNVHGGAWVGCDATGLDTQSQMLADRLECFVVNINYTKLDVMPFPYPQDEIKDTVLYFRDHAEEYGIDTTRFSLIGYSAGGHLCAGAAILLRDADFKLNSQFLCYPFLTFVEMDMENMGATPKDAETADKLMEDIFFSQMPKDSILISPAFAAPEKLMGLAPSEIITCGQDALFSHSVQYQERLEKSGVPVMRKDFHGAIHGFLEVNFPETEKNDAKSPEQETLMKQAIEYIRKRAFYHWNKGKEGQHGTV